MIGNLILVIFLFTWVTAMAWVLFYLRFRRKYIPGDDSLSEQFRDLPGFDPYSRGYTPDEIKSIFRFIGFILSRRYNRIGNPLLARSAATGRKILMANLTGLLLLTSLLPFYFEQANDALQGMGKSPVTSSRTATDIATVTPTDLESIAGLDQAIALIPRDANLYFRRGYLHEQLGDFTRAFDDFSESRALSPDHFDTYRHLDYILARQARWPEIIRFWEIYLERNPDDDRAWLERGGTWFRMGNLENSASDARRSCELGNQEGCQRYTQVTGQEP